MKPLTAAFKTMRPRQWLKNVLVFGAPAAAGVLTQAHEFGETCVAFVAFCLAASGTYCINDVVDREKDRLHPTKRFRPIAAGDLSVGAGVGLAVLLFIGGVAVSLSIGRPKLTLVLAIYVLVTLGYSKFLKNEPIIELGALAAGFVLRAIAGGVAVEVTLSNWFIIVACFGSLFVVTGKREAEVMLLGDDSSAHRSTLAAYSPSFLRYIRSVASGVLLTGYCLWAFENPGQHHVAHAASTPIWFQLSIAPFSFAVLRYSLLIDSGHGGAPEDVFLSDRTLQILGLCMAVLFAVGVYSG